MWHHFVLWLIVIFIWWKWRGRENLDKVDPEGKYIFITGCDSGFGKLAAMTFDRRGFQVIAGCLTEKGAKELKEESSANLQTVQLDVTNSDNIKQVAEQVKKEVGQRGLWGLINNAGVMGLSAPTDWLRIEHFRVPIEVNLMGLINVTLNMLPLVKKAKGRIVNVTSVGGILAICSGGYCPSKYGAEAFTNNLRLDMKPFGVKVSCIQPGLFKTDLSDRVRIIKEKVAQKKLWTKLCQNSDLSLVVRCMEHAVMSKYPKAYYSVGTDAKFLWIPLSKMPTFIQDYVLTKNKVKLFNPNSE
uniref:Dehydrogenase/reductase 9 n=1 Tax=Laticauda laticaudata TaxID=8630 RepID=A0A8C5WS46_LATLA